MKQLLIISGKGGTGKTSITAAFASLSTNSVFADCDVDAADLHLILKPEIIVEEPFVSGHKAIINAVKCIQCDRCRELCRFNAINILDNAYSVKELNCEGCGVCEWNCPVQAISLIDSLSGHSYISNTRFGVMSHAKLLPGADNSGKLVSVVRNKAVKLAKDNGNNLIIIDGPPGIGCPVIASMTGVDMILAVTEPSLSGMHDLMRILELSCKFRIRTLVCINKWDINESLSNKLESALRDKNIQVIGRIPYDKNVTKAQLEGKTIIEYIDNSTSAIIKNMWDEINKILINKGVTI